MYFFESRLVEFKDTPPYKFMMAVWATILSIVALLKNSESVLAKLSHHDAKIDALQQPMKSTHFNFARRAHFKR